MRSLMVKRHDMKPTTDARTTSGNRHALCLDSSNDILDTYPVQLTYTGPLADKGNRLINYLIDFLAWQFVRWSLDRIIFYLGYLGYGKLELSLPGSYGHDYLNAVFNMASIVIYYTLFEYFFKGKTLGKWITRTSV